MSVELPEKFKRKRHTRRRFLGNSGLRAERGDQFGNHHNVLDKHPPYGLTGTGGGSAIYDVFGRKFYGGIKVRY